MGDSDPLTQTRPARAQKATFQLHWPASTTDREGCVEPRCPGEKSALQNLRDESSHASCASLDRSLCHSKPMSSAGKHTSYTSEEVWKGPGHRRQGQPTSLLLPPA